MHANTNNHALDGGPATSAMEVEVVEWLAEMFGLQGGMGHLTSSGTIANLEALWVGRELHPGKAVVYGANAHYTHSRMCAVLGVRGIEAPADVAGRIDLDAVEELCRAGDVGTVVVTAGTTGTGTLGRRRAGGLLPRDATACACTSTPRTAGSSRCWRTPG